MGAMVAGACRSRSNISLVPVVLYAMSVQQSATSSKLNLMSTSPMNHPFSLANEHRESRGHRFPHTYWRSGKERRRMRRGSRSGRG